MVHKEWQINFYGYAHTIECFVLLSTKPSKLKDLLESRNEVSSDSTRVFKTGYSAQPGYTSCTRTEWSDRYTSEQNTADSDGCDGEVSINA